ncbi:MAG: ABC transporter transmembrane domain-containing protein, partial [Asticcacaulis sp.]
MTDTPPTDLVKDRPSPGKVLAEQLAESARKRDKSKDLTPLMRLWPYMRRQWGDGLLALLFMLISTSATLALTATVKTLVDHLTAADAAAADQAFVLVGLVTLVLGIATALRYFFVTKVGERVVADLRIDTYAHVLKLDPAFFIRTRTGEVLSRLTTDVQLLETLTTTSISLALRNALSLVGGLAMLLVVSPGLTGLVLLIFPVVLLPLFIFGRQVGKLTTKTQDRFAEAVGAAGENLDALETVQAFGREALASQRFAEAVNLAFKTSVVRMTARAVMTAMVITLIFGGIVAVLWLGAQGVRSGDMS